MSDGPRMSWKKDNASPSKFLCVSFALVACCFDICLTLSFHCQITPGAQDSQLCTMLHFGAHLEEHL